MEPLLLFLSYNEIVKISANRIKVGKILERTLSECKGNNKFLLRKFIFEVTVSHFLGEMLYRVWNERGDNSNSLPIRYQSSFLPLRQNPKGFIR